MRRTVGDESCVCQGFFDRIYRIFRIFFVFISNFQKKLKILNSLREVKKGDVRDILTLQT